MATQVHLAGDTKIQVAQPGITLPGGSSGSYVDLGWSRNGVTVSYEDFFLDVPGDEYGGDDGPPIEIQWLGSIARIRCELTKYAKDVLFEIASRVNPTAWGALADPGYLLFTNASITKVQLININDKRVFPNCIIRAAIEYNYATKYTSPIIEFEAHADGSGIVHQTL